MPRTKQRTPELQARLLTQALDLLEREGVAAFTTRSVAAQAATSTSAVYELFGDKGGLLRELYFEGFRQLRQQLDSLVDSDDPADALVQTIRNYRAFMGEHPVLSEVMFSSPFTDFDPSASQRRASGSVREFMIERVRRCIEGGVIVGDETDVAHVLVALIQGLAAAERARRLGTTAASINRRWDVAIGSFMRGFGDRSFA